MSASLQQILVAFLGTLGFIVMLARLAPRMGLVDTPDHRKLHSGDVPLVGGLAIFLTLLLCALLFTDQGQLTLTTPGKELTVFLLAGAVLVALGVADDRHHVSVFTRVVVEIAVALIVIEGLDLRVSNLGDLFGTGNIRLPDWLAYPFTVVCIFGVINAFNMLDGMDGLLAIMVLITVFSFHLFTGIEPGLISLTIVAALAAFLISNMNMAPFIPKTFLGDAGSKLLGFVVVAMILAVASAQVGGPKQIKPVTALYLVGLPLYDMVFTTLRRAYQRKSPFSSDRTHIHHLTEALGLSNRRSLAIIGILGISPPLIGLILHKAGTPSPYQFYMFLWCFFVYCVLVSQAWRVAEKYRKRVERAQPVRIATLGVDAKGSKQNAER
jgi:UDP-GlcNAc:undecaprenyl-phosphate GlcNAc-1-phosphate transferase